MMEKSKKNNNDPNVHPTNNNKNHDNNNINIKNNNNNNNNDDNYRQQQQKQQQHDHLLPSSSVSSSKPIIIQAQPQLLSSPTQQQQQQSEQQQQQVQHYHPVHLTHRSTLRTPLAAHVRHRGTLRAPLAGRIIIQEEEEEVDIPAANYDDNRNNNRVKKRGTIGQIPTTTTTVPSDDNSTSSSSSLLLSSATTETIVPTALGCVLAAVLLYPIEIYHIQWQTKAFQALAWSTTTTTTAAAADTNSLYATRRQIHPYRRLLSPGIRIFCQEIALNITEAAARRGNNNSSSSGDNNNPFVQTPMRQELTAGTLSGIVQALLLCPLASREVKEREKEEIVSWKRRFKNEWSYLWEGGKPTVATTTTTTHPTESSVATTTNNRITKQSSNRIKGSYHHSIYMKSPAQERFKRAYRGVGLLAIREILYNVTFFPLSYYLKQQNSIWLLEYETAILKPTGYYFAMENLIVWRSNVFAGAICSLFVVPVDILRTYYWYAATAGDQWNLLTTATSSSSSSSFTDMQQRRIQLLLHPWKTLSPPWKLLFRGWVPQAVFMGIAFGNVCTIYEWNYNAQ